MTTFHVMGILTRQKKAHEIIGGTNREEAEICAENIRLCGAYRRVWVETDTHRADCQCSFCVAAYNRKHGLARPVLKN